MRFFFCIDRALLRFDNERLHIALSCGFGLYLWIAQSFAAAGVGPGLRVMNDLAMRIAPELDAEAAWGSLMIGAGLLALMGLLFRQLRVRQIAALLLAALWSLMAGCFWCANSRSPACFTWLVFAWAALTQFYRLVRPAPVAYTVAVSLHAEA